MIKMKYVNAGYGKEMVLRDINLEFDAGQVTVLAGPNGCGKSTLLKTLVRMNSHTDGEIRILNDQIQDFDSVELAKHVAYLPQNRRTPDISVFRMVLHGRFAYLNYPRRYRKEDYEMAEKALAWVGIEELAEKNVGELSGGTQQKVYIAMALAQDTDIIVLDEPTTYLDIAHQKKMMELSKELSKKGKAVVMVLHDLAQAFKTADKLIIMDKGRVRKVGTPTEVFESGIIEDVFGVKFARTKLEGNWRYFSI